MKPLVTGDLGYVGSVLVQLLVDKDYEVAGLDIGYFADCSFTPTFEEYRRIAKDVRVMSSEDVAEFDTIIHLAGLCIR